MEFLQIYFKRNFRALVIVAIILQLKIHRIDVIVTFYIGTNVKAFGEFFLLVVVPSIVQYSNIIYDKIQSDSTV